jgi:hypothetical protein
VSAGNSPSRESPIAAHFIKKYASSSLEASSNEKGSNLLQSDQDSDEQSPDANCQFFNWTDRSAKAFLMVSRSYRRKRDKAVRSASFFIALHQPSASVMHRVCFK